MKTIPLEELLKHITPLPWQVAADTVTKHPELVGRSSNVCVAARMGNGPEADANATFLTHAANNLEGLATATHRLLLEIESILAHEAGPTRDELLERLHADHAGILRAARSALAKAITVPV